MADHTSAGEVKAWLSLSASDTDADEQVKMCVTAVNAFVSALPHVDEPTGETTAGATMLAARLFRRRNSPAGITAFGTDGGAVYVQRQDPDVAMLLGLGSYAPPRIG